MGKANLHGLAVWMAVLALYGLSDPAAGGAQIIRCVEIDGKLDDWGTGKAAEGNGDVRPQQLNSIDAVAFGIQSGYFCPDGSTDRETLEEVVSELPHINQHLMVRYWLRFADAPFSDDELTTLDILIDNTALDKTRDFEPLFTRPFKPTARIRIQGRSGTVESVSRQTYLSGAWADDTDAELGGALVGVDGTCLEGILDWDATGFPYVPDPPAFEGDMSLLVGFRVSLRGSVDVVEPTSLGILSTHVTNWGWGAAKAAQQAPGTGGYE